MKRTALTYIRYRNTPVNRLVMENLGASNFAFRLCTGAHNEKERVTVGTVLVYTVLVLDHVWQVTSLFHRFHSGCYC